MNALVPRPPHRPDDETRRRVRTMAACGLSPEQIALVMDVTIPEIETLYNQELRTGALMANSQVGAALLSVAVDRSHDQFAQCAFFWARARMGWRDVRKVETEQADLPEEQKKKLIDSIIERVNAGRADFIAPEPEKVRK